MWKRCAEGFATPAGCLRRFERSMGHRAVGQLRVRHRGNARRFCGGGIQVQASMSLNVPCIVVSSNRGTSECREDASRRLLHLSKNWRSQNGSSPGG